MSKTGRRLTLVDSMSAMDCRRRKSILRKLQKYRLDQKELASQVIANQERSLSLTSSLRAPSPSEDQMVSPVHKQTSKSTTDIHLPKIDIHSKQEERTKPSTDAVSAGVTRGVLSDDTTHVGPSTNVPYSLYTDAVGEDLSEGTSVSVKRPRDDLEISQERSKSPGVVSTDVTCTVLSDDTTQVVSSTDVPYSLYTDVAGERSGGTTVLAKRPRGDLRMSKDRTKSSRGVISAGVTRELLSFDTTQIAPSTNVPYSLYTDVVGERLSQGTSMMVKRPGEDRRIKNEALRVLPVNPKLTIDTGKCIFEMCHGKMV